jgi:FixJ family two-component response regulator
MTGTTISPTGMTYERALEIAIASERRCAAAGRVSSNQTGIGNTMEGNGRKLSLEQIDRIMRLTRAKWTTKQIADDIGITPRSVQRVRARERITV